jgi:hypothetical protein
VIAQIAADKKLTEATVQEMIMLFGEKGVKEALTLLDHRRIVKVVGLPSGRSAFRSEGTRGGVYCTLRSSCTCMAHLYEVEVRSERLLCKHALAARIGDAIGAVDVESVADRELGDFLWHHVSQPTARR